MKIAYIILTHSCPKHLLRLINSLSHPDDEFFVHVDCKINLQPFLDELKKCEANINIVKNRENGQWGGIGIVKATINALYEIQNYEINFAHIVLLSGSDYPIKKIKYIRQFYKDNKEKCFINYTSFPVSTLNFGGMDRINCYTFSFLGKRETCLPYKWTKHLSWKGKLFNQILRLKAIGKPKRVFPYNWEPFYGSQWWSISQDANEFICNFLKANSTYLDYHQYSQLPDEFFFQSLLLNAYPKKELIVNDNKRFIKFESKSSHPMFIDESFFEELSISDKLFARKFQENSPILNILDEVN